MKMKIASFLCFALVLSLSASVFAAGGKKITKLTVGNTNVSQGTIKVGENLTTREGQKLNPGVYRVAVSLNSLGEAQFILTPFSVANPALQPGLESNAVNKGDMGQNPPIITGGTIIKNLLVKALASNIEGTFKLEASTPTESVLSFDSSQFGVSAVLGRSLDSKVVDLRPSFLALDGRSDCGASCVEGNVKVTVKNEGNAVAAGKWNVTLVEPQLFVGTVSDVPAFGEVTVVSDAKVKLPCCNPQSVAVEIHADFYNKSSSDANDTNNKKTFTLKLKE
jgi:hypothetical protein